MRQAIQKYRKLHPNRNCDAAAAGECLVCMQMTVVVPSTGICSHCTALAKSTFEANAVRTLSEVLS